MDPVEPGLACGSDTAHLRLLGYDPRTIRGRGAFECIGSGIEMASGDIAFKCNFASMAITKDHEQLKDCDHCTGEKNLNDLSFIPSADHHSTLLRCVDKQFEKEAIELSNWLTAQLKTLPDFFPLHSIQIVHQKQHRCIVKISGPSLSDAITGTDPLKDSLPLLHCTPVKGHLECSNAQFTSSLINALSTQITLLLSKHPINLQRRLQGKPEANAILFRGCGMLPSMKSFEELHGFQGFMIAPTCVIAGIGLCAGLKLLQAEGATGRVESNWKAKFALALQTLKQDLYPFGFVHIKAVDSACHSKNYEQRCSAMRGIDEALGFLLEQLSEDTLVVVTGDHASSTVSGDHSVEPVPFVAYSSAQKRRWEFGRFGGEQMMEIVKRWIAERTVERMIEC